MTLNQSEGAVTGLDGLEELTQISLETSTAAAELFNVTDGLSARSGRTADSADNAQHDDTLLERRRTAFIETNVDVNDSVFPEALSDCL